MIPKNKRINVVSYNKKQDSFYMRDVRIDGAVIRRELVRVKEIAGRMRTEWDDGIHTEHPFYAISSKVLFVCTGQGCLMLEQVARLCWSVPEIPDLAALLIRSAAAMLHHIVKEGTKEGVSYLIVFDSERHHLIFIDRSLFPTLVWSKVCCYRSSDSMMLGLSRWVLVSRSSQRNCVVKKG